VKNARNTESIPALFAASETKSAERKLRSTQKAGSFDGIWRLERAAWLSAMQARKRQRPRK
ncbi:MAG: hypothetical protein IJK64_03395, partial [Clostridia bacterium]|nr:hypothetical protein [Clostridia bacterium]